MGNGEEEMKSRGGGRLWAGVGGEAVGGFGDAYGVDFCVGGQGGVEFLGELVGDVLGDVFGGWVEGIEGGGVVEVLVGEGLADLFEGLFEEVEFAEEAFVVEFRTDDGGVGFEVVAMGWFLGAAQDDGVGGAELVGDLDLEHGGW